MLIFVRLLTYSIYNGDQYKSENCFEKIRDDITKEELNKLMRGKENEKLFK